MSKTTSRQTKFWDKIAPRYAKSAIADEPAYERKLEVTRQYLAPHMQVMEFGCGTGSTALLHAPFVKHILATDYSPKMIEIAEAKRKEAGVGNVTFTQATLDDVNVPAGSFDVVLGLSILHLLEDPKAAMARVHQLLKPGGVFISSTACIADMRMPLWLILPVGRFFGLVPFVNIFTQERLVEDLKAAGFEIEHRWQPAKGKGVFIVARKPK